jgi:glutamate dehydrogenase/leucine dehydrogenase
VRLHELTSVEGVIAFDFEEQVVHAGGTRLVPDPRPDEAALLARAMTYKFGALQRRLGGAKAVVRATSEPRAELLDRYCDEIRPLVTARRFLTGADIGTSDADFNSLVPPEERGHPIRSVIGGVPFEDLVTGYGVAVAIDEALGGVDGRAVAIEGFGKVGGGIAREVVRRGGRVVALSTLAGCIADRRGLQIEALLAERVVHGDRCIEQVGIEVLSPAALFVHEADAFVPGARIGVLDEITAAGLSAIAVVPAANVPYTVAGLSVLTARGIAAHADFVCNAGGVLGYEAELAATPDDVLLSVQQRIRELVATTKAHAAGPFVAACELAEEFLHTWRDPDTGMPDSRPIA